LHTSSSNKGAAPALKSSKYSTPSNKLIVDDADDMEDENIFSSAQDSNAPDLVQIGTKIQPGISRAISLLYAVQEAMQFAHDNADPSLTILPI